jgi:site-specific recombinase XerD
MQFKEPSTHSAYHSALKLYYEKISKNGSEKFKYIERPKKCKKLPIVFSQEEVQRMFDVCENKKHKTILALLYSTGMRAFELINLKWENLDRSRMVINIIKGKGNKDRQVPLSVAIIPLLEEYWREYRSKEYVLNGQNDTPQYSTRSVGNVVKNLAEKAKINKRAYTHLMRHNCFTHMVENGVDINLIKTLAGHSSVKTTMIYTHISHNIISKIQSPIQNIKL